MGKDHLPLVTDSSYIVACIQWAVLTSRWAVSDLTCVEQQTILELDGHVNEFSTTQQVLR